MNDLAVAARILAARERGAVVTPFESDLSASDSEVLCSLSRHTSNAPLVRLDAGDIPRSQVVKWLRELGVDGDVTVTVVWPAYRAGVRLRFADFVECFDELWYPSSDDTLVTDEEHTWMITLDHEEIFNFGRR